MTEPTTSAVPQFCDECGRKLESVVWWIGGRKYHPECAPAEWTPKQPAPPVGDGAVADLVAEMRTTLKPGFPVDQLIDKVASALVSLQAERDALARDLGEATELLEKGMEPRLEKLTYEGGAFDAAFTGDTVKAMALAYVSHFKETGAENYLELNFADRAEPFQRYIVTVQKVGKLSPADKEKAALVRAETAEHNLSLALNREGKYREALSGINHDALTEARRLYVSTPADSIPGAAMERAISAYLAFVRSLLSSVPAHD